MFVNSQKIINLLEQLAPRKLAEDWDNIGLLIGSEQHEISKIMVVLDIDETVLVEAIEKNVDLIITHHPFIFKGMKTITDKTYHGRMIRTLIKEDIHVYAAHTNLDVADNGLNDYLAHLIGLENLTVLNTTKKEPYYKLYTMVPKDSVEVVEEALYKSGAGRYEHYDQCSFKIEGRGSFRPLEGSNPTIGVVDKREHLDEVRIEVLVAEQVLDQCIKGLIKAHPYETPAYSVIKIENLSKLQGLGRVGVFREALSGRVLIEKMKEILNCELIRVAGQLPDKVLKVGLCTGAGADFIHKAKLMGCDVYITGDLKYHEAQLANQLGLCIFDCGHYETEQIYMTYLAQYLQEKCLEKNYEVKLIKSESLENPIKVY